ncbi:FAD-dependent monooxygenase [Amorphoplanes nipponensis]|uniref:FAD-dependent oxidoreductase n=1 Tax=Actinoplanes nipponensis TaxID=135950 RepID=A0A919JBY5_9ACTN|nr:FAD-dependent monooxygenase [Actinoplanes nipponensis]GIE47923.1 FAD-dependent oxidoreductase [Actinoplanes nipponensis]
MRVLISGGGIAGPALAFWLARHGIGATIVERAPAPRPGGQTVDIRGAARTVVDRMGLREAIRARQVDERGVALVDGAGRRLAELPADLFGGDGIVAETEILRGDLADVLRAHAGPGVEHRYGDRLVALAQDPHGVDVRFASGRTERFDVVVGADGVHSGVRELAFGPEREFVRHLGAYTGWFSVPDPGDLDHWFLMHNAPGGRVAGLRPARDGAAMASLTFTSPPRPVTRELLAERMAGVGWRVPALLAGLREAGDCYLDAVSRVRVRRWARGRVVLLGDAGYCGSPLAGQGTSLALVGAYVLAGELAAGRGDPPAAFAAYQRELAAYVAAGTRLPPGGVRGFAPHSAAMIALRAASTRMMTRAPLRAVMARQFAKADRITLKEYAGAPG